MAVIYIKEEEANVYNFIKDLISEVCVDGYVCIRGELELSLTVARMLLEVPIVVYSQRSTDRFIKELNPDIIIIGDISSVDLAEYRGVKVIITDLDSMNKIKNIPYEAQIITCGFKEKDSVTFTSVDMQSRVLSIERKLKDLNGQEILPQEYKVDLSSINTEGYTDYTIMAGICALLCINCRDKLDKTSHYAKLYI